MSTAPIAVRDLGTVPYREAWELQRATNLARAADEIPDTLMLLQHPAVYTAGKRTEPQDRPMDGTEVIDVDRGGKITWHGPGQLVGYPIIKLAEPMDVVDYVRRIEEALIAVAGQFGVTAGRSDGRSGVWLPSVWRDGALLPERKLAAIGIRVQRGVTMHGFALNADADLSRFGAIVPCGIPDAGVTSLSLEAGRDITVDAVRDPVVEAVTAALVGTLPVTEREIDHAVPAPPATRPSPAKPETVRF